MYRMSLTSYIYDLAGEKEKNLTWNSIELYMTYRKRLKIFFVVVVELNFLASASKMLKWYEKGIDFFSNNNE